MTKYSDEQRQAALTGYQAVGAAQASRNTGIPARTIRTWANKEGLIAAADTKKTEAAHVGLAIKRERLRGVLLDRVFDYVDTADPKTRSARECKDFTVAAAVLIDKFRLESGDPTAHEHHTTDDDLDKNIRGLLAELDAAVPD